MRTTLNIDDVALAGAMKTAPGLTKTAVINEALINHTWDSFAGLYRTTFDGTEGLDDPAGLPVLLLTAGAWSFATLPIANGLSRAQVYSVRAFSPSPP